MRSTKVTQKIPLGMKRLILEDKMDKRQQLIKSETKLFVENGFVYIPTSKVSKEAGVATGTLFTYFKSKEDLINQVFFEIKKEMYVKM